MYLKTFTFHLRARNLSPHTILATEDYLRPFLATRDPLQVTRHDSDKRVKNTQKGAALDEPANKLWIMRSASTRTHHLSMKFFYYVTTFSEHLWILRNSRIVVGKTGGLQM